MGQGRIVRKIPKTEADARRAHPTASKVYDFISEMALGGVGGMALGPKASGGTTAAVLKDGLQRLWKRINAGGAEAEIVARSMGPELAPITRGMRRSPRTPERMADQLSATSRDLERRGPIMYEDKMTGRYKRDAAIERGAIRENADEWKGITGEDQSEYIQDAFDNLDEAIEYDVSDLRGLLSKLGRSGETIEDRAVQGLADEWLMRIDPDAGFDPVINPYPTQPKGPRPPSPPKPPRLFDGPFEQPDELSDIERLARDTLKRRGPATSPKPPVEDISTRSGAPQDYMQRAMDAAPNKTNLPFTFPEDAIDYLVRMFGIGGAK